MAKVLGKSIAVAGSIQIDRISSRSSAFSCTGCVPNVAIMLKKLSPQTSVSAVGKTTDDARGNFVVDCLKEAGVDASGIKLISGELAENSCGNEVECGFGIADMVFRDLSCKILHLGYFLTLPKLDDGEGKNILRHARRCGIETSISMLGSGSGRYNAVLAALPYVDYLLVDLSDAAKLSNMEPNDEDLEKIARKLFWHGVKKKVFIYGSQWLACCSRTQYCSLGNYILPQATVCTQAQLQDAFCAGVLAGLSNGWSDMKILEFASSCTASQYCREDMVSALDIRQYCKALKRYKKEL